MSFFSQKVVNFDAVHLVAVVAGKFSHPLNNALARSMEVSQLLEKYELFSARR